jgi:hypothetical protein
MQDAVGRVDTLSKYFKRMGVFAIQKGFEGIIRELDESED